MNPERSSLPAAAGVLFLCAASPAQSTQLVSVDSAGAQANSQSRVPVLSANGRFVAFASPASNLVPGDTNGVWDIFVRDRLSGVTERVSVSSAGVQGDGESGFFLNAFPVSPAISADGRYMAFESAATNLVAGDTNGDRDIFLRDRQNGTTERLSVSSTGAEGNSRSRQPSISPDGRWVVFQSDASNFVAGDANFGADIFVRDRQSGTTECVTLNTLGVPGDMQSFGSSAATISSDGRFVAFRSLASDLVPGDVSGYADIFVRDRLNSVTELVSVSSAGVQAAYDSAGSSISLDGRFVAFSSIAANLVAGDTNGQIDTFVRDRQSGTTERVSLDSSGAQASGASGNPSISGDGRFVVFESGAPNLVPGDTNGTWDVCLRDRLLGTTERLSVDASGGQGNSDSGAAVITANGNLVAFDSVASNLVVGDSNAAADAFVRDRGAPQGTAFCAGDGSAGACPCGNNGTAGRGCENSASTGGAQLAATGTPSLSFDTLLLASSGELPSALSIFLQGSFALASVSFGDGLRCTGGVLKRVYVLSASGGVVSAPRQGGPSISARSATLGDVIAPGTTRYYQTYYRDPVLAFCANPPGNSWNISSGRSIVWDP